MPSVDTGGGGFSVVITGGGWVVIMGLPPVPMSPPALLPPWDGQLPQPEQYKSARERRRHKMPPVSKPNEKTYWKYISLKQRLTRRLAAFGGGGVRPALGALGRGPCAPAAALGALAFGTLGRALRSLGAFA